jgi:hypothetical protein
VPLGEDTRRERPRGDGDAKHRRPPGPRLGELPLARRDVERLRQILALQRRLRDRGGNPRAHRSLVHRHAFRDALTWFEIHGESPELAQYWKGLAAESTPADAVPAEGENETPPFRRRRRRRRRRYRAPQER